MDDRYIIVYRDGVMSEPVHKIIADHIQARARKSWSLEMRPAYRLRVRYFWNAPAFKKSVEHLDQPQCLSRSS
jgi:tagatose-1,6-bisphosphate aldolase non-catalytic subunit AgaZ/GatZ